MRANAREWEPGRRETLETLLSDFVPPFPASGRRNVGALPRKVSSCQTGVWDDAERVRLRICAKPWVRARRSARSIVSRSLGLRFVRGNAQDLEGGYGPSRRETLHGK